MSPALIAGCLWVVASAVTGMLPMRYQYAPGITLLLAAPVLIVWLGVEHGWIVGGVALAAFLSMFRNPLRYFAKKSMGIPVERPGEARK